MASKNYANKFSKPGSIRAKKGKNRVTIFLVIEKLLNQLFLSGIMRNILNFSYIK